MGRALCKPTRLKLLERQFNGVYSALGGAGEAHQQVSERNLFRVVPGRSNDYQRTALPRFLFSQIPFSANSMDRFFSLDV
jgi:hypothetical protein